MPKTMADASDNARQPRRWKDPLLQYLAENTNDLRDRPALYTPRSHGAIGRVPDGATACTLADAVTWWMDGTLHERLSLAADRSPRIAFDYNLFNWRPWGIFGHGFSRDTTTGGAVSVRRHTQATGACHILRNDLREHRAWLWTVETEKAEGVYLSRRQPKVAA